MLNHYAARCAYLFCAILFGTFFLQQASAQQKSGVPALTPVKVQLNWRHQFEFAAFYAAIEKGYYKQAGLDVQLIEGGAGVDAVQRVVSGQADFGVANSSLVLAHARGQPVVALGALMQHSAFALLARRSTGISNLADLDGKVISCAPHACDEIRAYLKASGLSDERVRYVPLKSTIVEENLRYSDATDVFVSNQGFQLLGREHQYVLFVPMSAGIDLYGDILFTSEAKANSYRTMVSAFRAATMKGLAYAHANQDELIDLILSRYNTQNKTRAHLKFEAVKLRELTRPDLVEPGYMSEGRWRHVRDVYASLDMVPVDYPVENMLFRDLAGRWPGWAKWALGCLGLALVLTVLTNIYFRGLNLRLRREVQERLKAEADLKAGQENFRRFVEEANSLVAHEVRTPIAVLHTQLDVLEVKQSNSGSVNDNLVSMRRALSRLERLFEKNLQQVFDSSSKLHTRKRLDLAYEVSRLVASYLELTHDSRVSLRNTVTELFVYLSPAMVETVVYNLLENAGKYSIAEQEISVYVKKDGDGAVIEVENISVLPVPQNPEYLFTKHQRGLNSDQWIGTGVGLHLVRLIAETHGGEARIHTDAQKNTFLVRVSFPLATNESDVSRFSGG